MKQTRARRPQPAIREQRANVQGKAAVSTRGGSGRPRAAGFNNAADKTNAVDKTISQPYNRKLQAATQSMRTGAVRRVHRSATVQDQDEWHGRPADAAGRTKPAQPRVASNDDPRVIQPTTRAKAAVPVAKAKRMRQRADSQKVVAIQKQLRAKRLTQDQVGEERLQKALAFSGIGSRREMEEWIAAGRVSIDGKMAKLGAKVKQGDEVRVDGKRIALKWQDRLSRVLIYHKEEGEIVTRDDPEGRTTVFDRLPRVASSKWIAIGRLDFNTSGLLIFTTSGDLANRMMHPSFEVEREYAVRIHGELTAEQMQELRQGVMLDDGLAKCLRIVSAGGEGQNHWYHVVIKEGRNREVRRMFEHYGLVVSRLMRVRFGMLNLPSRLKRGQFYELSETEVMSVMKWAGLRLNGQAKADR